MSLPLNITEHNVAMYGIGRDRIDLRDGSSEYAEQMQPRNYWYQEHCMSGEVMEPVAVTDERRKLREFVQNHVAHTKDAGEVKKFLELSSGSHVFVKLDGEMYEVSKSYGASYEFPVVVRKATVIEA